MKKLSSFITLSIFAICLFSCSKSEVNPSGCFSDNLVLTQTKVNNLTSSNSIIVSFDVKNKATTDYNVLKSGVGSFIYYKMIVKTTDGTLYETKNPFISSISAGATQSQDVLASYGAGKTYQSYTVSLYCQ